MRGSIRGFAVILVIVVCGSIAYRAVGQQAASQVGYVDLVKLHEKSQAYKKASAELEALGEAKREELQHHEMFKYLTGAEAKRAVELRGKPEGKLTKEEMMELVNLRNRNNDRNAKITQLLRKQRTPEEEKELQSLQAMMVERGKEVEQLSTAANKDIQAAETKWNEKLRSGVDAALSQTARELELTVVLQKRVNFVITLPNQEPIVAGDDVVLWGGTDVTERLIELLDKIVLTGNA